MKTLQRLLIFILIFFMLINTSYFWEGKLFGLSLLVILILAIVYIVLIIIALVQLVLVIKERFKNRLRNIVLAVSVSVVILVALFPRGIIRYDLLESDVLLLASREGAANCTIALKLRKNNTYSVRNVCFGITETSGDYTLKGDTIFFDSEKYGYGVIKERSFIFKNQNPGQYPVELHIDTNHLP